MVRISVLEQVLRKKWYPGIIRWPALIGFAFLTGNLLFGTPFVRANFGLSAIWYLWWPMLSLCFLLAGRVWCAVCPFALVNDLVQKIFGNNLPVPAFLKKHGLWIATGLLITLTYVEFLVGIIFSTRATAILLLVIFTFAVASGAFFRGRVWCRYLCPLGAMAAIFSKSSIMALRATPDKCATCRTVACYKGTAKTPACPMFQCARVMDNQSYCNFCGNCLKNCPHDALRLFARIPTRELWSVKIPQTEEAFLVALMMGTAVFQSLYLKHPQWGSGIFGLADFNISMAASYVLLLSASIGLLGFAAFWVSRSNKGSIRLNFARLSYLFIPLVLANQVALTMVHEFLNNGRLILYNLLPFWGWPRPTASAALVNEGVIRFLEYLVLLLGFSGTFYTARRVHQSVRTKAQGGGTFVFISSFILLITAVNLFFYLAPFPPSHGGTAESAGLSTVLTLPPARGAYDYNPPRPEDAPSEIRELVILGYRIMQDAQHYAGKYVGNPLSCSNCHFNGGITCGGRFGGLTLVGVTVKRPDPQKLHKASNVCFVYSMNGKPLPPESQEMQALDAYYHWISSGISTMEEIPWYGLERLKDNDRLPDHQNGKEIYTQKCAACHHLDGAGSYDAPAVWGTKSYTSTSPMARPDILAAFTRSNMPLSNPDLTVNEAQDVAGFINAQPRIARSAN